MNDIFAAIHARLPLWADSWIDVVAVASQVFAIALVAWLAMRVVRRLIKGLVGTYALPSQVSLVTRRVVGFVVYGAALLWSLERMGFSATVLWTAFTGFATVGAVAFFAAWSVLSNLFCALLIFTTRIFRIGDLVELIEASDKPGLKGRVVDINLVYTTLNEASERSEGTTLHVPNSLFFQRALRRWASGV